MPKEKQELPEEKFVEQKFKTIDINMGSKITDSVLSMYDPEKEFQFIPHSKTPLFSQFIRKNFFEKGKACEPKQEVEGDFLGFYTDKEGKVQMAKFQIRNAKHLSEVIQKAEKVNTAKLRETISSYDFDDSGAYDFPSSRGQVKIADGDVEYTPMMAGAFSKQLYLFDYLVMHSRAFEMWNHNPIAHQIVKVTTYFVLGRGVQVQFKNPDAQKHWDSFVQRNDFYHRLTTWSDMLTRDGELMVNIIKDPINISGTIQVRAIDPSTIWEIITDPEDIEKVYYYHQQYPTQYQTFYNENTLNIPSTKYVIHQFPAAEILHYKINCNANEKRGRSDLFPVMTWLKRIKDFYTARVIRAIMQSTIVWKAILKGSDTDVQAYIDKFGTTPPLSGSLHVENESSTLSPMTVDLKAADARDDGESLINLISIGTGIPKEYLGVGDKSTRATALVASEPGYKKFQARQELFKKIVTDIAIIVTKEGMNAGKIPPQQKIMPEDISKKIIEAIRKTDWWLAIKLLWLVVKGGEYMDVDKTFDVIIPELITEDRSKKIQDLTLMQINKWISREKASQIAAKEMHIDDFDYREEEQKIKAEEKQDPSSGDELTPELSRTGKVTYKPATGINAGERAKAKESADPKIEKEIRERLE